jgi:hypothetical protein
MAVLPGQQITGVAGCKDAKTSVHGAMVTLLDDDGEEYVVGRLE